jgi:hypothetical protein
MVLAACPPPATLPLPQASAPGLPRKSTLLLQAVLPLRLPPGLLLPAVQPLLGGHLPPPLQHPALEVLACQLLLALLRAGPLTQLAHCILDLRM